MLSDMKASSSTVLKATLAGGLGIAGVCLLSNTIKNVKERRRLTSLRVQKQKECAEQLENFKTLYPLGPNELNIVRLPFEELVNKLQKRQLKARQVLEAYIAKAVQVTSEFNCVTEFIPHSLELADQLDARVDIKGPLHGVPFCVKDDHDVKGMDSTLGCSKYLYQPASSTAVVVQVLVDAGGIPFCKTNLPQTTVSGASDNPIFGTTVNPLNKALCPGGSSSGTGCLVKAGGAPFGTGSDSGGSVRIPSHMCGIATIRPTFGRNSLVGLKPIFQDMAGTGNVSGIMAPSIKVVIQINKILWSNAVQNQHDPLSVPLPFNEEALKSKKALRIGYYTSLPTFPALGDIPATVLKAKDTLEKLGHTLIEFEIPLAQRAPYLMSTLCNADGGEHIYNLLKNDAISHVAEKFVMGKSFPSNLIASLMSVFKSRDERMFGGDPGAGSSAVLWTYLKELRLMKHQVLDKMKELDIDVLLGPVLPFPAPKLEHTEVLIMMSFMYTAIWNMLDFPAGTIPFGKESGSRVNEFDDEGYYYFKLAKENVKAATGMPIGVQVIARPFKEELVLRVLNELEDVRK